MELFHTNWHLVSAFAVFLLGLMLCSFGGWLLRVSIVRSCLIYFWHTLFCIFYALYVISDGGDAVMYYVSSIQQDVAFSVGTSAVRYFVYFFSVELGFSFIGVALVFNIFGVMGLLAFDAALQYAVRNSRSVILHFISAVIVFIPSISFWSAGVGKDAVSFMAVGFLLWAAIDLERRLGLMLVSVLAMFLVRPHVAGVMVFSLVVIWILASRLSVAQKIFLGGSVAGLAVVMLSFIMNYVGLSGQSIEDVVSYIEQRQGYNQEGGGGVDISEMSIFMQVFTYLFRPLPFEADTLFSLAAALENSVFLLAFLLLAVIARGRLFIGAGTESRWFLWCYAVLVCLMLSVTTANLGIAVRQKWMFMPVLMYIFIAGAASASQRRVNADAGHPV